MCTSETQFCNDPFDENNIDDSQKRWSYIECQQPPPDQFDRRVVCKKVIQKGMSTDFITIYKHCDREKHFDSSHYQQRDNLAVLINLCHVCASQKMER